MTVDLYVVDGVAAVLSFNSTALRPEILSSLHPLRVQDLNYPATKIRSRRTVGQPITPGTFPRQRRQSRISDRCQSAVA